MKGQRKMVTVHVYSGFVGALGGYVRTAFPVARITRLEELEPMANTNAGPIAEARTKLYDGKDSSVYVRETVDEIVSLIEGVDA